MQFVLIALCLIVVLVGVALAIERGRRRRAEILAKEVEELAHYLERNRIARELHDAVGHDLTLLGTKLDTAIELRNVDPERAEEHLAAARIVLNNCMSDMRKSLNVIRDPAFDFTKALVGLVAQLKANKSLDVKLSVDANDLTPGRGHEIFRIVQECLNNVQKHSRASRVEVEIAKKAQDLQVNVSDNGQGFKAEAGHDGQGLKGIAERVEKLKGNLQLDSSPTRGTKVKVNIPNRKAK